MTDSVPGRSRGVRRFRWVYIAPVLAWIALAAWAFASPLGAGPDDDYHLVSIWCANGGSDDCGPGTHELNRTVPATFPSVACYAQHAERSGECQEQVWLEWDSATTTTERGNFAGEYPPVYYAAMRALVGDDVQTSALAMRLVNAALFVGIATALAALLPAHRRGTLLWGWLVTLVPLGMFLIPSNNPSGWAITGVGTAFLALFGWFETAGGRRWALGALYLVGVIMAAGARGDAAVYAAGASIAVIVLTSEWSREWAVRAFLPLVGIAVAVFFFATAGQSGVGAVGFTSGGGDAAIPAAGEGGEHAPLGGFALAAYNLLMLPFLWTGVWGGWGLGWLDTQLPAIVVWAASAAFIVVGFAGLGRIDWRKLIASSGVLTVLVALPVYVLTVGGDRVGANLQPRYLLPLIVLFALILVTLPRGHAGFRFTRIQTALILGALVVSNLVALQVNIRRYVTGADQQGFDLDAGAEWWWSALPLGPTAVWVIGTLSFAGLLVVLWPHLRRDRSDHSTAVERA